MDAGSMVKRARNLRRRMSLPEVIFWQAVRKQRVRARFRRQHPFGPYIVDFYCLELKLAVEIDGATHDEADQFRHDERRDAFLRAGGVRVIRVPASAVLDDVGLVLEFLDRETGGKILPRPAGP